MAKVNNGPTGVLIPSPRRHAAFGRAQSLATGSVAYACGRFKGFGAEDEPYHERGACSPLGRLTIGQAHVEAPEDSQIVRRHDRTGGYSVRAFAHVLSRHQLHTRQHHRTSRLGAVIVASSLSSSLQMLTRSASPREHDTGEARVVGMTV
jgi:hypothetical protein